MNKILIEKKYCEISDGSGIIDITPKLSTPTQQKQQEKCQLIFLFKFFFEIYSMTFAHTNAHSVVKNRYHYTYMAMRRNTLKFFDFKKI